MNDKSAVEMVLARWNIADRGRGQYAERAIENEKLYRAYIDETSHPYLSNICLPWPYIITESYLGKCIQMLAAMMPYVRVVEDEDDDREKAKNVERDANMCLYLQKWPILAYKLYKQAFKYPNAWLEIEPWGNVAGREMPIFRHRNWFQTWVNPSVISLEDLDCYIITIDYVPIRTFEEFVGNKFYKNLDKIEVWEGDIYTEEENEIKSFKSIPTREADKYSKLVKVTRYWSYYDFIIMTNDNNVIRNQDTNFLGVLPFKSITPLPVEDEFYGMSILDEGKGLFENINENENQYNDAVNLLLNPQWIINRSAEVKRSQIVTRSGGIIWTDDVNGIVPMKVDWNILAASGARKSRLEMDLQNYSNAFPQMRGAPQTGSETATEYMGMRSAGELRSDTYNLLLSMLSVEDMVADIVRYKKMFMTDPSGFFYWPDNKPRKANPSDYAGSFSFKAVAQYKMAKEIERKQLIEAMTLVFGNQAFIPLVAPRAEEWLSRLLDYFGLRDADQLFASQEEQQAQQAMMMLQGMMGGGQGGGNGGPLSVSSGQPAPALGEREMRMPDQSPNPEMMGDMGGMAPSV